MARIVHDVFGAVVDRHEFLPSQLEIHAHRIVVALEDSRLEHVLLQVLLGERRLDAVQDRGERDVGDEDAAAPMVDRAAWDGDSVAAGVVRAHLVDQDVPTQHRAARGRGVVTKILNEERATVAVELRGDALLGSVDIPGPGRNRFGVQLRCGEPRGPGAGESGGERQASQRPA